MRFTCEREAPGSGIRGCGENFTASADHEQLIDCPHCGIWWSTDRDLDTGAQHGPDPCPQTSPR